MEKLEKNVKIWIKSLKTVKVLTIITTILTLVIFSVCSLIINDIITLSETNKIIDVSKNEEPSIEMFVELKDSTKAEYLRLNKIENKIADLFIVGCVQSTENTNLNQLIAEKRYSNKRLYLLMKKYNSASRLYYKKEWCNYTSQNITIEYLRN